MRTRTRRLREICPGHFFESLDRPERAPERSYVRGDRLQFPNNGREKPLKRGNTRSIAKGREIQARVGETARWVASLRPTSKAPSQIVLNMILAVCPSSASPGTRGACPAARALSQARWASAVLAPRRNKLTDRWYSKESCLNSDRLYLWDKEFATFRPSHTAALTLRSSIGKKYTQKRPRVVAQGLL